MTNEELFEIAKKARENSRCALSNFAVGAALLCGSGKVYMGCNIEEEVLQCLSNCAERVAFQSAIANGETKFEKILVVGGEKGKSLKLTTPCGVCRQYIVDMAKDIQIVVTDGTIYKEYKVSDLLVDSFILDEVMG